MSEVPRYRFELSASGSELYLLERTPIGCDVNLGCVTPEGVASLIKTCASHAREIRRMTAEAHGMAHMIVTAGVVPGIDPPCRCEECRSVARLMAEAGYLAHVKQRWWEDAPCPKP